MANAIGIARPYARAIYELAQQEQAAVAWQSLLASAALILQQPEVISYVTNPKVSGQQASQLVLEILDGQSFLTIKNLINILAQERKLALLPAIAELFAIYTARDSQTEKVSVLSATELDATTKEKLLQTLAQRLQKKIEAHYEVDPSLIGGAVIRTSEWVLDGSIKHQLQTLRKFTTEL